MARKNERGTGGQKAARGTKRVKAVGGGNGGHRKAAGAKKAGRGAGVRRSGGARRTGSRKAPASHTTAGGPRKQAARKQAAARNFPGFGRSGGRLRHVDWDEWFECFDQRKLVFLFQEQLKRGNQSAFFQLDSRDLEEG